MSNEIPGREWFQGTIGRTLADSEPHFRPNPHPGEGAPNVLVILYDDLGFGHLNCFGSTLHTPNADRLAAGGVRFTNFHVTPVCSPTRACLLTGRNHHTVGMRAVSNMQSGFPSAVAEVSRNAGMIGEVLQQEGYGTGRGSPPHVDQRRRRTLHRPVPHPLVRGARLRHPPLSDGR